MSEYDGSQFVGIDLHRRRSVIVRTTGAGEALEVVRITNDLDSLAAVMARAGEAPQVVLEASYGWYWGSMPEGRSSVRRLLQHSRHSREPRSSRRSRRRQVQPASPGQPAAAPAGPP